MAGLAGGWRRGTRHCPLEARVGRQGPWVVSPHPHPPTPHPRNPFVSGTSSTPCPGLESGRERVRPKVTPGTCFPRELLRACILCFQKSVSSCLHYYLFSSSQRWLSYDWEGQKTWRWGQSHSAYPTLPQITECFLFGRFTPPAQFPLW